MPISAVYRQSPFRVRFDWAQAGAEAVGDEADVAVVVDVLSFTTTLSVALDAGTVVLPYRWGDDAAPAFARDREAVLAVGRTKAGEGRISLSPKAMRAHAAGGRVVLPSPNGSTIAHALGSRAATCVAAALRNAEAVAAWIDRSFPDGARIAVVAAGERWPDGSLRPAVEDLWGAGAVLAGLADRGRGEFSPEALMARVAYDAVRRDVPAQLRACVSGAELVAMGFADDVEIAAEVGRSDVVPVLRGEEFVDAGALG